MQGNDDFVSAASTIESSPTLESLTSLIVLFKDKEDELKTLRKKAESLHEAYHAEKLERARLEYRVHTLETEHAQVIQVHKLELDVALAQKKGAWNQLSASADKFRAEIQALQLKHATEMERVLQDTYPPKSSSTLPLRTPRYPAFSHQRLSEELQDPSNEGTQVVPDESTFRKDLRRADTAKMARLMSAGDSVSTGTTDQGEPQSRLQTRDNAQSYANNRRKCDEEANFPGVAINNTVQTRWHEERFTGTEEGGQRTQYQKSIQLGKVQTEISALTFQTFEMERNVVAVDSRNQPRWLRQGNNGQWPQGAPTNPDQAAPPSSNPSLPSTDRQQAARSETPVVPAYTIHAPKRVTSDGVAQMNRGTAEEPAETDARLLNRIPIEQDDGRADHDELVSADPSVSTDDDDDHSGPSEVSTSFGEDQVKVFDRVLADPYGDRGVYTGVILLTTGMPHGDGRIQYVEVGRSYDGEWRHGRWYGFGKATFSNGDTYDGMYVNDKREGPGVYKWRDGRVYDGEFNDDKRHGKGTFIWPDGSLYDGDFFNGQRDGHGIYQYADGGRYEGGWEGGKYNGVGTCVWADGRKYHGEWKAGVCHGEGVETLPDGSIRHQGQWVQDAPLLQ